MLESKLLGGNPLIHFINNWRPPRGAPNKFFSFAPFNFWISWGDSTVKFCIGACVLNLGLEWLTLTPLTLTNEHEMQEASRR